MTTAQLPVDILRTALERIRDDYGELWGGSRAAGRGGTDVRMMCMYCGEEATGGGAGYETIIHDEDCGVTVARTALAEAAALAAEMPVDYGPPCDRCGGHFPVRLTMCNDCMNAVAPPAAPPPAPVPGGMLDRHTLEVLRSEFKSLEKAPGMQRLRMGFNAAALHCDHHLEDLAAATPPEVVAGMPDPRCKECGHTKLEHEVAEPHRCVVCFCAAFDDVKTGGKLLASHPLVKPPATPPVRQQGEVCGKPYGDDANGYYPAGNCGREKDHGGRWGCGPRWKDLIPEEFIPLNAAEMAEANRRADELFGPAAEPQGGAVKVACTCPGRCYVHDYGIAGGPPPDPKPQGGEPVEIGHAITDRLIDSGAVPPVFRPAKCLGAKCTKLCQAVSAALADVMPMERPPCECEEVGKSLAPPRLSDHDLWRDEMALCRRCRRCPWILDDAALFLGREVAIPPCEPRSPAPDPKPTVCGRSMPFGYTDMNKPYGYGGDCQREPNHEGPCGTGTGTERSGK